MNNLIVTICVSFAPATKIEVPAPIQFAKDPIKQRGERIEAVLGNWARITGVDGWTFTKWTDQSDMKGNEAYEAIQASNPINGNNVYFYWSRPVAE